MSQATRPLPLGDTGGSIINLREHNLSQILLTLAAHGPLSRAEIAARSGLGVTALTKLVAELRNRELVTEVEGILPAGKGRPTSPLGLARHRWAVVGLMLDKRSVEVCVGSLDSTVGSCFSVPAPETAGIEAYLPSVETALRQAAELCHGQGRQILAVEVGIPGAANNRTGEVIRSILNGWSRFPLRAAVLDIVAALGHGAAGAVLVGVDRETNYSMLARIHASGASDGTVAYLGGRYAVSGGIFSRSTIEHGSSGLAGEFGHVVIDPAGAQCWCGRRGCVETRLGLAGLYARCTGARESDFLGVLASGHPRMIAELLAKADDGDARVLAELDEAGHWLGIAIDTVAAVVNPHDFVVDGFVAALGRHLERPARRQLDSIGALPSIADLKLTFEDGTDVVRQGMLLAACHAVAAQPSVAAP